MKTSLLLPTAVLLLERVIASGYTNVSEVPYYGLSPPVYPTRKLMLVQTCTGSDISYS
jgi:hypothetical protein